MKKPIPKLAAIVQTPVFHETPDQFRLVPKTSASPKPPKRENTFSKSRDVRENRDAGEVKTSQNDQSNHAR